MKHTIKQPDFEQACAVVRFANTNDAANRGWKPALHIYWMDDKPAPGLTDDDRCLLRQVRNQCGPLWLEQVSLPALTEQCTQTFLGLAEILVRKCYGLTLDDLGIEEGGVVGCILNGESVLELVNDPAQDCDLGRIDKSDYGVPSTAELTRDDLAAAIAELNR